MKRDEDKTKAELVKEIGELRSRVKELEGPKIPCPEERYPFIFEDNPYPMWVYDEKTLAFLAVNDAAVKYYGYSRDEFLSMTIKDIRPPEDIPALIEEVGRVSKEAEEYVPGGIWKHIKKDGTAVEVEIFSHAMTFEGKRARAVLAHDVTARKKIEDALLREINLSQAIIDSLPGTFFVFDMDGNLLKWNENVGKITGYSTEEIAGLKPWDFVVSSEKTYIIQKFLEAFSKGSTTAEASLLTRDGRVIPYFFSGVHAAIDHTSALVGVGIDISEMKSAEDALRESEKRFREIFDEAPDGILVVDVETKGFYLGNKAICNMLGYFEDEIMHLSLEDIHPEKDLPHIMGMFETDVREGLKLARNVPFKRKDGSVFYADINTFWLTISGKKYLTGIVRDITDRIRMEEEVEKTRRLESIGILAGGIAHDYNNLMTAVMGNISLSKAQIPPDTKAYKWLNEAEKACELTRELSSRLIVFSKGGEPFKETSSISEIVRETAAALLNGSNNRWELILPEDLYLVEIDRRQIRQVVSNMIINAVESMPGGGDLKIYAENSHVGEKDNLPLKEGDYLKLSISDTGRGIDEEELPKIFDPYYTSKEMGSVKGTGLGLSVCYSIIKKHGGSISVESMKGSGTTFHIYLPASERQINKREMTAASKRILVMDDEEVVRKITSAVLKEIGFEVEVVKDGLEAVEAYSQAKEKGRPFDAVILDLTVPGGMGGEIAIKKLIAIDPGIKGIVMSGYAKDPVLTDYKEYGFAAAIAKPFTAKQLIRSISSLINIKS